MSVTHVVTTNGKIHGELKSPDRTPTDELRHRVNLLDGVKVFSLGLWQLPPGQTFDRVDLAAWPQAYIQTAGAVGRLMVEVRRLEGGIAHQYVVGRQGEPSDPDVMVKWNGCETVVHSNEVFVSDEVADLFIAYYRGEEFGIKTGLRELRLNEPS